MAEQVCGNYTTITDIQGRNALKGAIAFEGYAACECVPTQAYRVDVHQKSSVLCLLHVSCHALHAWHWNNDL